MAPLYDIGAIVWVRLGQKWWPGRVTSLDNCPIEFTQDIKKNIVAVVKFFNEQEYFDINREDHICSYQCPRREDLIRKGINTTKNDPSLLEKFEADVKRAEKLTGGNMNVIQEIKHPKRKINYGELGFGQPKNKKSSEPSRQLTGHSNIGEAIQYKKNKSSSHNKIKIEHKVKFMEQPKITNILEAGASSSSSTLFKCYTCGFMCSRVNVLVWHNKEHIKTVANYDTGIRMPRKNKRKQKNPRSKKAKIQKIDHSLTNGHDSSLNRSIDEASQLLLDWEDDDLGEDAENDSKREESSSPNSSRIVDNSEKGDQSEMNGALDSDIEQEPDADENVVQEHYDDNYPPPLPKGERIPMPKQDDINSAFDALLATTSSSNVPTSAEQAPIYAVNDDSDSECSDWEKYYAKDSDSESSCEKEQESDIKSLCDKEEKFIGQTFGDSNIKTNGFSLFNNKGITEEEFSSNSSPIPELEQNSPESVSCLPSPAAEPICETPSPKERSASSISSEIHFGNGFPVEAKSGENNFNYDSLTPEEPVMDIPDDSPSMIDSNLNIKDVKCSTSSTSDGHKENFPKNDPLPNLHDTEPDEIISSDASEAVVIQTLREQAQNVVKVNFESPTKEPLTLVNDSPVKSVCTKNSNASTSNTVSRGARASTPSNVSSNSSTGPAYMLVAVDGQGNNVPMPVLSEGGNHLVAVEASMEDGTTRTLYIDPAHLGPNVDLNNLMLHIDNSGQETVIIPTSSADGEIMSSTLFDRFVGSPDSKRESTVKMN